MGYHAGGTVEGLTVGLEMAARTRVGDYQRRWDVWRPPDGE